jgi:glycosyltransferase involved in cell wall biosynthesis
MNPYLSLVIPVYNEEETLPLLFDAVYAALQKLPHTWEVILVNDGSRDKSFEILKAYAEKDTEKVRVISFRRNFGQTAAMAAGIDHAKG